MIAPLAGDLAAVAASARSQWAVDLGALGGSRTPNLLIRRFLSRVQRCPDRSASWHDRHLCVHTRPPGAGSRSRQWLPTWLSATARKGTLGPAVGSPGTQPLCGQEAASVPGDLKALGAGNRQRRPKTRRMLGDLAARIAPRRASAGSYRPLLASSARRRSDPSVASPAACSAGTRSPSGTSRSGGGS